ncbi:MAG: hypothetical protein M3N52_06510, partial [Actinomycetota bacterium]|nr:hypothetical protein [Actinomycetota bacterium]
MLTQRASLSVLTAALLLASAAPAHASCDPLVPTVTRCEDSPPEMRAEPPPPPAPEPQPADQPQP